MTTPSLVEGARLNPISEQRRSPRIHRAVRLMIVGQDRMGQWYREKMSTESLNLQGCCYLSTRDVKIGTSIQLQLVEGEAKSPIVSASVRSVRPKNSSGFYQTGVEFDKMPQDWLWVLEATPAPVPTQLPTVEPEKVPAASVPVDVLVAVLQWKLEHAAEKAVKSAIQTRVDDAVKQAFHKISEIRSMNERQAEALATQQLLLEQSAQRSAEEFEAMAARVVDRQLARLTEGKQLVAREIWAQVDAFTARARAELENTVGNILNQFQHQLEVRMEMAISETRERANSSLACLEAENHTACKARRQALENDVTQVTEKGMEQFRSGIKAFLYASLVAAVGAVDEHAERTLAGLVTDRSALRQTDSSALTETSSMASDR